LTASHWLREELQRCEQEAGTEFIYTATVPEARPAARRASMVLVGADRVRRLRRPLTCPNGLIILVALDTDDEQVFADAARLRAQFLVMLPTGRPWLVARLLGRFLDEPGPTATGPELRPTDQ
jgi:hypothetical protein